MERYEIWQNGTFFAGFAKGDSSRFGKAFNREIAIREFDACLRFWKGKGIRSKWELRIRVNNTEPCDHRPEGKNK